MNDAPLGWAIAEIHGAGLPYNEVAIRRRFPNFDRKITVEEIPGAIEWTKGALKISYTFAYSLLGLADRVPNDNDSNNQYTQEAVHWTTVCRGFGVDESARAVPGHNPAFPFFEETAFPRFEDMAFTNILTGKEISVAEPLPFELRLHGLIIEDLDLNEK